VVIIVLLLVFLSFPVDVLSWYCGGGSLTYTSEGILNYKCTQGEPIKSGENYCCSNGNSNWSLLSPNLMPCSSLTNCPSIYAGGPKVESVRGYGNVFVSGTCRRMCLCEYGNCAGQTGPIENDGSYCFGATVGGCCPYKCGDNICTATGGETCANCPGDCGGSCCTAPSVAPALVSPAGGARLGSKSC
jgi:hypothetical protein